MTQQTETLLDKTGQTSMVAGTVCWIVDKMEILSINDILTGLTLLFGLFWMIVKIKNEMLTTQIKKQIIKDHEDKNI